MGMGADQAQALVAQMSGELVQLHTYDCIGVWPGIGHDFAVEAGRCTNCHICASTAQLDAGYTPCLLDCGISSAPEITCYARCCKIQAINTRFCTGPGATGSGDMQILQHALDRLGLGLEQDVTLVPGYGKGLPTPQQQQALIRALRQLLRDLGLGEWDLGHFMGVEDCHPRRLILEMGSWINNSRRIEWAHLCAKNILHGELVELKRTICAKYGERRIYL